MFRLQGLARLCCLLQSIVAARSQNLVFATGFYSDMLVFHLLHVDNLQGARPLCSCCRMIACMLTVRVCATWGTEMGLVLVTSYSGTTSHGVTVKIIVGLNRARKVLVDSVFLLEYHTWWYHWGDKFLHGKFAPPVACNSSK